MSERVYSAEFADFLEELGADETVDREFKEAVGGLPRSIWETISAFANTSGGIIALGIREADDGLELVGVPHPRRLVQDLHGQCRNRQRINQDVLPAGNVSVREIDGLSVVIVRVRPAERRARPVYINGQAYGGTYLRRHTGDHRASDEEVNRLMREASDLPADQVILPWARLEHLDRAALSGYRQRLLTLESEAPLAEFGDQEFLEAIGGYRRDLQSGEEGITVAGLLMFGTEAAIRNWRPRHLIDARLLPPGADRDEPDWADRVTWESHLYGAFFRMSPWLTRDLPVPFRLEQGVRIDDTEQHRALREALVNLLVHADYSERAASLILRWDGGVYFRNPGPSRIPSPGLHGGNRSDPRNPALLRMFRRIGLSEEAGTGVPRIVRAWRELGYEPPQIEPENEVFEFALTLPNQHLLSADDREWLAGLAAPFSDAEQLALAIARQEEGVDNQALRAVTGMHGSDVSRVLTGLRNRGFLEMVGSKRGAWYRLAGESSGSSTLSFGSNARSSGSNALSSGSNALDSSEAHAIEQTGEQASRPTLEEDLRAIAAPVRERRRVAPDQLAEIVVALCAAQPLSLRELMALLDRSEKHVRTALETLEQQRRIKPLHQQRRHPRQQYEAVQPADRRRETP